AEPAHVDPPVGGVQADLGTQAVDDGAVRTERDARPVPAGQGHQAVIDEQVADGLERGGVEVAGVDRDHSTGGQVAHGARRPVAPDDAELPATAGDVHQMHDTAAFRGRGEDALVAHAGSDLLVHLGDVEV